MPVKLDASLKSTKSMLSIGCRMRRYHVLIDKEAVLGLASVEHIIKLCLI